uniref:Uncharacterized LOC107138779 n=1 Tax=Marmota marmota marmota TaxID=9994 RepID=A0A8C5YMV3_MARMA
MEQRPRAQPSVARESSEAQQEILAQSIEGRGRVLLVRELWKQDDCCKDLQNFPEQASTHQLTRSSSTRATIGHSTSSNCTRRGLKRSGDSSTDNSENNAYYPAAKSKRSAEKAGRSRCKYADPREPETPGTSPRTPGPAAAENPATSCRAVGQPRTAPEQGAQLLLVLCRASALCSQLPRLQLVLEQVRARDCRPPAALIGILVQPQPDEEAEARCLLENLLCGIFAQHNPAVEVHTAVFCPGRPQGVLDVQRAASQIGPGRGFVFFLEEGTWERSGLPGLLACFTWGPWSQRKDQDATSSRCPAQENFQDSQEELALTTIFPNGDCEDRGSGPKACDGVVHTPPEPTGETR